MSDVTSDVRTSGDKRAETMRRGGNRARLPQNISQRERLASTLGGSVLVLAGVARGKLSGLLMALGGGGLLYRGWTGHCHCYDALGIDTSEHGSATAVPAQQGAKVEHSIIINRPREELYAFWREVENLPRVMRHLERVEAIDVHRSRWTAKGPMGTSVEWEAEIFNEREPDLIAWRSLPGSEVDTAGSVRFESLGPDRGTVIAVSLKYNPPAGKIGATVASLLGSSVEKEVEQDLRRFKNEMETGESPTTQGESHG